MVYKKFAQTFVIRLEIGEDLCACLLELARKEDIGLASVSGIGASSAVEVGMFDVATKSYTAVENNNFLELVSLAGNMSLKGGEPYLHLHAALADPVNHTVLAGHLTRLIVGATAEIFVSTLPGMVERSVCPHTGLNLLDI
ncbi:MAG: DUF296 domain-containing protein [Oscillospiraceae bacterium]|nr:DUF296 domain-containing protein [Oscillospiraceae bacterium]